MRASRLLHLLLLLQDRGRQTSAQLAAALEVDRRTILRDVDALTEAGLPVVTHRGARGGVELAFNYRSRLTGLAADEAEALAVILALPAPELSDLGLAAAGARARSKLVESLPDASRAQVRQAQARFRVEAVAQGATDPRVAALAEAIRNAGSVTLQPGSAASRTMRPVALIADAGGWRVRDGDGAEVAARDWGDVVVSALSG